MKRHFFEILLLLVAAAVLAHQYNLHQQPPPAEPDAQLWAELMRQGNEAMKGNDFQAAELRFKEALAQAELFPAFDDKMAETLDDMGLLYFQTGQLERCLETQRSAVAALVLAAGPQDSRCRLFLERLHYAAPEDSTYAKISGPVKAIRSQDVETERAQVELRSLVERLEQQGLTAELGALEQLVK